MIEVTRFDGSKFYVNAHQIEFVEATPDTVISLVSGKKIVVKDDIRDVIKKIIDYRRSIGINLVDGE